MVLSNGIIPAIIFALLFSIAKSENAVPVYVWNIDTDVVINAMPAVSSQELVSKLSLSLDRKLIAVFLQNELSTEDFKSDDLAELKTVAQSDENDGVVYAPAVIDAGKLPEILESSGFQMIHVKSSEDLPSSPIIEKTVLVIDLPTTDLGASRSSDLQQNGDVIREVYEVLKSRQPDVIGVFTATKNSKLLSDESRKRITRNAVLRADDYQRDFLNVSNQLYLFLENAPVLKFGVSDDKNVVWTNFTLSESPVATSETSNTSATQLTNVVRLEYSGFTSDTSTLTSAIITLTFATSKGYWSLTNATVDFAGKFNGQSFNQKNVTLTPDPIVTPYGSSYHCTPKFILASYGYNTNASSTNPDMPSKIAFEMNGFQLQPFKIRLDKFGDWYDCQGFFTEGIWAAIFIGLVLAMMLAWAASMLDDIKGPDRFDDPKGKTITITATE